MSYATTKHQTNLASTSDVRFRSSIGSEQIGINTTIRRIDKFRQQYGEQCLHLACHAALPVVLNAELLHLLRINFFFDPPESLPYTAEADILLSVLCSAIDEDLYEIEAEVRDALLHMLMAEYGQERVRELATLLWQYTQRCTAWLERPGLVEAQQLTALNFLDAGKAKEWLAKEWLAQAESATKATGQANHAWFVAMHREIERDDLSLRVAFEYLQNLGRQQGYVTYDDVLEAMPGIEERDLTQVEDLFAALFEEGIEVGQAHETESNPVGDSRSGVAPEGNQSAYIEGDVISGGVVNKASLHDTVTGPVRTESGNIHMDPPQASPAAAKLITNVWYLEKKYRFWQWRNPDVGTLELKSEQVHFRGRKHEVQIAKIQAVTHGHQPGDLDNNWVKVSYLDEKDSVRLAFFADATKLGIGNLVGGSDAIFQALRAWQEATEKSAKSSTKP